MARAKNAEAVAEAKPLKIEFRPIGEIKPYPGNPRRNDKAVGAVVDSIRKFGFKIPLVLDRNNVIVTGHTRLMAAKRLGMAELPVLVADDLTPEQIKAFRIVDNASSDMAEWDLNLLGDELKQLDGFDMSVYQLKEMFPSLEEATMVPEPPYEYHLKPYRRVHYLITVDLDKHDRILPLIAQLREMDNVSVDTTIN